MRTGSAMTFLLLKSNGSFGIEPGRLKSPQDEIPPPFLLSHFPPLGGKKLKKVWREKNDISLDREASTGVKICHKVGCRRP